jgi:hypothetical protein
MFDNPGRTSGKPFFASRSKASASEEIFRGLAGEGVRRLISREFTRDKLTRHIGIAARCFQGRRAGRRKRKGMMMGHIGA